MEDGEFQFEKLEAWQQARTLILKIYQLIDQQNLHRDFALKDQLQRAAISVMNNIAEGFERTSLAEKKHFYTIARASCGEVRSMLYLVEDLHPILKESAVSLRTQTIRIGKLISGLIRSTEARIQNRP